ncbi:MAG: sigma-70 family RNA polymerase sigma factor, partial [Phycisphaerales bacterium]
MEADLEITTVRGAQRDDEDAWRKLFEWHFEAVYRYCLSLSAGRQEMADEIAQQVFMTAARRIGRFKPRQGTFRAWLLGIARNRFMKLRSKELRDRGHQKQLLAEASGSEKVNRDHLLVHKVLAELPVRYRSVLEAKYLQGLTVNQIAKANSSTPKAAESLL